MIDALTAGASLIQIVLALFLGLVLVIVVPAWALIEVAMRRDLNAGKGVWIVLMVLFWGLTAVVYGVFGTRSRVLRATVLISLIGGPLLLLAGTLLGSRVGRGTGAATATALAEMAEVPELAPGDIPKLTLRAVRQTKQHGGAQVGELDLNGFRTSTLMPVDAECTWTAYDGKRKHYYCVSWRSISRFNPSTGKVEQIAEPDDPDFSHVRGVAWDDAGDRILMAATSGAGATLFAFGLADGSWDKLTRLDRGGVRALAWEGKSSEVWVVPDKSRAPVIDEFVRFNTHGAKVGSLTLNPGVPNPPDANLQLIWDAKGLFLVVAPVVMSSTTRLTPPGVYWIDPASGSVRRAP